MSVIETGPKPVELPLPESESADLPGQENAGPEPDSTVPEASGPEASGLSVPEARRRPITGPQRIGGVLLAAVCLFAAVWYVPRIVSADNHSFTGTVSSSGVSALNFAGAGRLAKVSVQLGQVVKAGQVLATESAPAAMSVTAADQAAIAADRANIAGLRAEASEAATTTLVTAATLATEKAGLAAADAQLAKDKSALESDQLKLLGTEIIAPAGGTVVAVNGQVGETVSANGIHEYSSQAASSAQTPAFSLLPEGPRSTVKSTSAQAAVPVIALRTSLAWQVVVLIPQGSAQAVRVGQIVTISVPAAHLSGVRGHIQELSPTPVTTANGIAYQAVVNVLGHQRATPLSGMAVDVQLDS